MGFSIKKALNLGGKAAGAAVGAFFGGPAGAVAGFSGSDAILGTVGLGDDQLAAAENYKMQKKASDYAYNQNLKMWNLQNAYNDPAAQMARLQAAGLNPNLVYGGGNVTGNAASSGPTYERPGVNYEDKSLLRKQLSLALEEHNQRITNQAIQNDLARQQLVLAERNADRSDALADAQIKAMQANLGVYDANIGNIQFNQERANRQDAWTRYKHDVDVYDALVRESYPKFNLGFTKFGFHGNLSGKLAKQQREIIQKFGFRPTYSDYLRGLK